MHSKEEVTSSSIQKNRFSSRLLKLSYGQLANVWFLLFFFFLDLRGQPAFESWSCLITDTPTPSVCKLPRNIMFDCAPSGLNGRDPRSTTWVQYIIFLRMSGRSWRIYDDTRWWCQFACIREQRMFSRENTETSWLSVAHRKLPFDKCIDMLLRMCFDVVISVVFIKRVLLTVAS
jgi:hypothetical protein